MARQAHRNVAFLDAICVIPNSYVSLTALPTLAFESHGRLLERLPLDSRACGTRGSCLSERRVGEQRLAAPLPLPGTRYLYGSIRCASFAESSSGSCRRSSA